MFATQVVAMEDAQGQQSSWRQALLYSFGGWMTWVPISLGLYWLVQRHPVDRDHTLRSMTILMAAAIAVVFARATYVYGTNPIFLWYGHEPLPSYWRVLTTAFFNNFLLAWTVIGIAHALVFYQRSQERGKKLSELQASLTEAKLEALRAQLNPHFLFNALNSVAEMVHRNAELADHMLVAISALLRDSFSLRRDQLRPLARELILIKHYLMIEKLRLEDRLRLHLEIDEDCLDAMVPALILQPLVENAIVHGIAPMKSPGTLTIRARNMQGKLEIEIENAITTPPAITMGAGVGLRSTHDRLSLLYGKRASLQACTLDASRYLVRIVLPAVKDMDRRYGLGSVP